MIEIRILNGTGETAMSFDDASRLSTDEHNNLEIWGGAEGDILLYVCAQSIWIDATISDTTEE